MNITQLINAWSTAKFKENEAKAQRRHIENQIAEYMGLNEAHEGTTKKQYGDCLIQVKQRHNAKIDSEALQEIAAENGLSEHLSILFRWKPEINAKAWKQADDAIIKPLQAAITRTPARPSFKISDITENK